MYKSYNAGMDTKTTISSTEARQNLAEVIDSVEKTGVRYTLTVNGKPKVVIVNAEEFESLQETLEILSDAAAMKRIRAAEKELSLGDSLLLDDVLSDGVF